MKQRDDQPRSGLQPLPLLGSVVLPFLVLGLFALWFLHMPSPTPMQFLPLEWSPGCDEVPHTWQSLPKLIPGHSRRIRALDVAHDRLIIEEGLPDQPEFVVRRLSDGVEVGRFTQEASDRDWHAVGFALSDVVSLISPIEVQAAGMDQLHLLQLLQEPPERRDDGELVRFTSPPPGRVTVRPEGSELLPPCIEPELSEPAVFQADAPLPENPEAQGHWFQRLRLQAWNWRYGDSNVTSRRVACRTVDAIVLRPHGSGESPRQLTGELAASVEEDVMWNLSRAEGLYPWAVRLGSRALRRPPLTDIALIALPAERYLILQSIDRWGTVAPMKPHHLLRIGLLEAGATDAHWVAWMRLDRTEWERLEPPFTNRLVAIRSGEALVLGLRPTEIQSATRYSWTGQTAPPGHFSQESLTWCTLPLTTELEVIPEGIWE